MVAAVESAGVPNMVWYNYRRVPAQNHGVEKIVTLRINDCLLRATIPAADPIATEDRVRFSFVSERLHGFDAKTGLNLRRRQ